jgi:hypothetical protein
MPLGTQIIVKVDKPPHHRYGLGLILRMHRRELQGLRLAMSLAPLLSLMQTLQAQPVSGVWHGKVDARNGIVKTSYSVELKLVRQGDSLYGTSYYHSGRREYVRFPVRGYFNPYDGTVTWWHTGDTGIDERGRAVTSPVGSRASFVTDFNCPGGEEMSLDGEMMPKEGATGGRNQPIHFEKVEEPLFSDEWDDALSDPSIDVANHAEKSVPEAAKPSMPEKPLVGEVPVKPEPVQEWPVRPRETQAEKEGRPTSPPLPTEKPTTESLYGARKKKVVMEIPLKGDTLELNFYDHAEIDGDTIAVFHNGTPVGKHVGLKAEPFTLRFDVGSLPEHNEITMVAENQGRIPPNTSLLIAYVDGVRYEARLESTEKESATVRFDKPKAR